MGHTVNVGRLKSSMRTPDRLSSTAWLCEGCGYPLLGIDLTQACPECGRPTRDSLPQRRTGLAWQQSISLWSWFRTAVQVLRHPRASFGAMRVGGPNLSARLYLLSMACSGGGLVVPFYLWAYPGDWLFAWMLGMIMGKLIFLMTYVKAVGVTFFSRRRGWRVGFTTAERVTAYASVGWPVAVIVFAMLLRIVDPLRPGGWLDHLLGPGFEPALPLGPLLAVGAAILGFEFLVWTGVRQVRFANPPDVLEARPERSQRDIADKLPPRFTPPMP